MSLSKRVTELSPEKRRLLALLMKEQSVGAALLPLAPVERSSNVLPCSFAQQRLWFLDNLEPGNLAYIVPGAFRFDGPLNLEAFSKSVSEVIRRHEILRTRFTDIEGEPMQVIEEPQHIAVPLIDLSGLPEPERAGEVQRLTEDEAGRAFDLERAPLMRVTLLKLSEHEHIVLLTMHHIISDGWSMTVLLQEVAALYEAFSKGHSAALSELPIQYADYAVWQREHLRGQVLEEQLTYWKKQLHDAPAVLDLPSDRPRPAVRSSRGSCLSFALTAEVVEGLRTLSRREGTTMFMTLLAALKVLLYRYTRQSHIVVGTSVAGRNRKELEGLIGFFVNSLVLHTELSSASTFLEVLGRVKETALGAYAHQELPFERLVEEFQSERSLSHTPLFQVFFSLQNAPRATKGLSSVKTEALGERSHTSKFDLSLDLMEGGNRIGGSFQYNTDLFDAATIRRIIGHFQNLLEAIAADPARSIDELPLLSPAEERQLLVEWNDTQQTLAPDKRLHDLFEAQVARTPDAPAVLFEDAVVTYEELNRRANRLAHHLRDHDVRPEVVVGIMMERSVELVVAMLGVLKAGGACLPLDPTYPARRLEWMLKDAGVKLLLSDPELTERVFGIEWNVGVALCGHPSSTNGGAATECRPYNAQAVRSGVMSENAGTENDQAVHSSVMSENAAYVIYTSGSTGQPKGVVLPHRGLLNRILAGQEVYRFTPSDRYLQKTSISFDVSVCEIFWPLLVGAQSVLARPGAQGDTAYLADVVVQQQLTYIHFAPSMLQVFLQEKRVANCDSLRAVFSGGEALSVPLMKSFFEKLPARLYNQYGPTEISVSSSYHMCQSEEQSVPIGRPFANYQMYVLGESSDLVPLGVTGEVCVAGLGVARGYLKAAALTAERFVPHPYSTQPGARMYRTGDLGRWLESGEVEFLGRRDQQVKIRGYRIELGEIESVLTEHQHVREAVVLATDNADQDKRLTAYLVMKSDAEPSAAELRRFVAERLPAFMVPAGFVQLRELPLTRNGKIDRAALLVAGSSLLATEEDYVAARTAVEEILCGIWSELLSVERVGVYDNFFQLGGHSLLATRVLARVRDVFEVEVPLRSLFESPTIATMAEQVELAITTNRGLVKPPVERIPRNGPLPVSYVVERRVQREFWAKENSTYIRPQNVHAAIHWSGPLDLIALEQSVNEIIRRHEILRTNFDIIDGRAVQFISEQRTTTVSMTDLRHVDREARKFEATRLATDEVMQRFDLTKDQLLRVTLIQLDDHEYVIVFVADHAVCDGWSMDIFSTEFTALYNAFTKGEPSPLAELPFQYADFSHWQRNWLQGEVLENLLSYWKKQLNGHFAFPEFELPIARTRPEVPDFAGDAQAILFSAELTTAIKSLSRRKRVTTFMMLLAGLKALLHRHSGRESIGVISPTAYRTSVNTESLIGWFAQLLVLRTDVSGDPTFSQLLERVSETTLGAFMHQDIPLPCLLEKLSPIPWSESVNKAAPHVFFNLDTSEKGTSKASVKEGKAAPVISDVRIRQISIDTRTSEPRLTVEIEENASKFAVLIGYETSCYNADAINELLEHFESLMEAAVANPELRLSELPLMRRTNEVPKEAIKK